MKLVKHDEFIKLPAGTLYVKADGVDIEIKGEWTSDNGRDWSSMSFGSMIQLGERWLEMSYGESYPIQTDNYGRDGCFVDDQEFLIYESWDLQQLRSIIDTAISVAPLQKFKKL
jgi:hypothetical protein